MADFDPHPDFTVVVDEHGRGEAVFEEYDLIGIDLRLTTVDCYKIIEAILGVEKMRDA